MNLIPQAASEIALRGRLEGENIVLQMAQEPIALAAVPDAVLLGLGAFLLSAAAAIAFELNAERQDRLHSAARF